MPTVKTIYLVSEYGGTDALMAGFATNMEEVSQIVKYYMRTDYGEKDPTVIVCENDGKVFAKVAGDTFRYDIVAIDNISFLLEGVKHDRSG